MDSSKARAVLGCQESDPAEMLRRSVGWHLENPPAEVRDDWAADEVALG